MPALFVCLIVIAHPLHCHHELVEEEVKASSTAGGWPRVKARQLNATLQLTTANNDYDYRPLLLLHCHYFDLNGPVRVSTGE
jgi:hypothetical protein